MGQCSGVTPERGVGQGPVAMVVTCPFVVTVVVSRLVPTFELGCDPHATPAPTPTAKRNTVSVSRIACQLRPRRTKGMLVAEDTTFTWASALE